MFEIERKYLVKKDVYSVIDEIKPHQITQAYLVNEKSKSVRIRIMDDVAFLTIKSDLIGITRKEYEYEIPVNEALSLIESFGLKTLNKKRYKVDFNSKTWEIDVFDENLDGLVLAEIELQSEDEKFARSIDGSHLLEKDREGCLFAVLPQRVHQEFVRRRRRGLQRRPWLCLLEPARALEETLGSHHVIPAAPHRSRA